MNVFVTGATGHLGFNLVNELVHDHHVTISYRTDSRSLEDLERLGARPVKADLMDTLRLSGLLLGHDAVYHLAAENTTDASDPKRVIDNAYALTRSVFEASLKAGVKRFVYVSSVVVLGRSKDGETPITEGAWNDSPESPYVEGKMKAERYLMDRVQQGDTGVSLLVFYPSWIVGRDNFSITPPQRLINGFFHSGQKFCFPGGISIANVTDVAKTLAAALEKGSPGEGYIVAGHNVTYLNFFKGLSQVSNAHPPLVSLPRPLVLAMGYVAEKILGSRTPVSLRYLQSVVDRYGWYDSSKARDSLGYQIGPLENTLKEAYTEYHRWRNYHHMYPGIDREHRNGQSGGTRTILITGFPGWLGSRFLHAVLTGRIHDFEIDRGWTFRFLVLPSDKRILDQLPEAAIHNDRVEFVLGDVRDVEAVRKALDSVDAVFHLAGVIYPRKIEQFYSVNTEGARNLVDLCIEAKVRRICFMSTDSVVGRNPFGQTIDEKTPMKPFKNYGRSKHLAEEYIMAKQREGVVDATILRGFWFWGPMMPDRNLRYLRMFKWSFQPVFGNGKNLRSLTHVDNVVQAFFKSVHNSKTFGKSYWICNDQENASVDDINRMVAEAMGVRYRPFRTGRLICNLLGVLDTLLGRLGMLNQTVHVASKFHFDIYGSSEAAKNDFGYRVQADRETIKAEIKEFMRYGKL